jgi:hypothetical protein
MLPSQSSTLHAPKYPGLPMSSISPVPFGVQPSFCCVQALEAGMSIASGP